VKRLEVIEKLGEQIASVERPHPVRVAIDGVDAAGKTILADELVAPIQAYGRTTIRASIDGFHNPHEIRYQDGPDSPEGYYHHSFNYEALISSLLESLGPDGSLVYRKSMFDFKTDRQTNLPTEKANGDEILLFDGVFLLRPELVEFWDYAVFVDVSFETSLKRAMERDRYLFGEAKDVRLRYTQRYIPGQKIYLHNCQPKEKAHAVLDNNDLANPVLIFQG
jgi:uridine kinase